MSDRFKHQEAIIKADPKWAGLFLGTGGGKTRLALDLAEGRTLVIAPKQQTLDETWQRNAEQFDVILNLTVISKETFRRDWNKLPYHDTIIVDEGHHVLGVTPDTRRKNGQLIPKTSQMFDALLSYTRKYPPKRFYIVTATPASKPMNVWAIATLFGMNWDFFRFREKYYIQRKSGWRSIWLPRGTKECKEKLIELIKKMGYTGKLSDWFDVPEQTHEVVHFGLTQEQKNKIKEIDTEEADPMAKRTKKRTIENGCLYDLEITQTGETTAKLTRGVKYFDSEKVDYILERAEEFPRMLIFANYIGQIEQIRDALEKKGHNVFVVTGQTKDRGTVFQNADAMENVIVIAQSSIAEGYQFKNPLGCIIFASKNYRFLYYEQALGRSLRADALNKNLFLHLIVKGGIDEECHKSIMEGKDFQEKIYD